MKLLLKVIPMILVILGLFLVIGCEDTEGDDVVVNPLVGTWSFTDMTQSATYMAANADLAAYGVNAGDTLGAGTMDWATLAAMGVNGTVAMLEDGTFTLTGNFPIASDTLGVAPTITPLTDAGVWTSTDTTLLIDGAFYDIGGMMTLNDAETVINLVYASVVPDTVTLPLDLDQDGIPETFIPDVAINAASSTSLEFTKQ